MRLKTLAGTAKGRDLYVVGSGPTLRYGPAERFLRDKLTVGLNQAWRHGPWTYGLTVHPELVVEYEAERKAQLNRVSEDQFPHTRWLVKKKAPLADLAYDDPRYVVFDTGTDWALFERPRPDTLFIGRGVQCTALHLALLMGARAVVLVGVDLGPVAGEHHAHDQHVRFHGLDPADVYREMRDWTAKARDLLAARGVPVYSLSPLLGASPQAQAEDLGRLRERLALPPLPPPADTSGYVRAGTDRP